MGNPTKEKAVFARFIKEEQMFADAAVKRWDLAPSDPPDIECDLEDGRTVGVELTSWLDEIQMGQAKRKEILERSFEKLLMWEPNNTENFGLVWLSAKRRLQFDDEQAFRSELLILLDQLDKRWPTEPDWQSPQGFLWNDFAGFSTLKKYLDAVDIHPRVGRARTRGQIGWMTFPMNGGAYSPNSMVDALYDCTQAKVSKYSAKPANVNEFHLLVHYDQAFAYNSPVEAIDFGYEDAVAAVLARIGSAVGVFDRIFVYVSVKDGQKVFRMYP